MLWNTVEKYFAVKNYRYLSKFPVGNLNNFYPKEIKFMDDLYQVLQYFWFRVYI